MRDGPEWDGVPGNQAPPRCTRPSNVTLVVTRPLGATCGLARDSWATTDAPRSTAVEHVNANLACDDGMVLWRLEGCSARVAPGFRGTRLVVMMVIRLVFGVGLVALDLLGVVAREPQRTFPSSV